MNTTDRREFLRTALAGSVALFIPRHAARLTALDGRRRTADADSRIEVLLEEPIGTIAPEIYVHFVEHLGGRAQDIEFNIR